jgi:hypothetical protein
MRLIITALFSLSLIGLNPLAYAACLPLQLCARITGLQDTPLGTWGGTGDLTSNYTLCAFIQNDDESNYEITGTGTGPGNTYILSNGTTDISATVEYEEDSAPGWVTLNENIATIFPNPNTVDETCAVGGDSGKIRVTVDETVMQYTTSGAYSGTINLLVSPD